jgi:hypothetical protein
MFERFTSQARGAVVLAQEEARALRHNYIGTEHILLGLLREEQGLAAVVLGMLDVTVDAVRAEVLRIVGSGEELTGGQIPFTPRAKKVLELSLREATSLGHDYIGTEHILLGLVSEHILLGLVREDGGVAARILIGFGADAEKIRGEVLRMLSGPVGGRLPESAAEGDRRRPPLDWRRARMLWRPEGLELRIPLALNEGASAAFAADAVWSTEPLTGLRREVWDDWLGLASPSLLEDVDPAMLRRLLDAAAERAVNDGGAGSARVEDFLRRLRDEPPGR